MRLIALAPFFALAAFVSAHGADEHVPATTEELIKRNTEVEARNVAASKCAAAIAEHEAMRRAKREGGALAKRQGQWTPTSTAPIPRVTSIQNSTCVLHPEVIEGPYYIRNEHIRTDLRETQPGVPLILDIGVINSRTCQPFSNAFVELWAANATGAYGGYVGAQGTPSRIHDDTWLRGGWFTDPKGIVELTTIYPGFYTGRTAHIHAMVHNNWQGRANGTLLTSAGAVTHIGQFFFDEQWNDRVYVTNPYNTNTVVRTRNNQDFIMQQAGRSSLVSLSYLSGSSVSGGLLGYITVVVDGNARRNVQNQNAL